LGCGVGIGHPIFFVILLPMYQCTYYKDKLGIVKSP
jgi:hypothetical protein